jgi:DNA-binding NarL/FixJ family response regulator
MAFKCESQVKSAFRRGLVKAQDKPEYGPFSPCSGREASDISDYGTFMALSILIVDDSEIFRQGLRTMIERQEGWRTCGEAADGLEAIQKTHQLKPDLIVMDLSMPRMAGIEASCEIRKRFPKVPILLLTLFVTRQLIADARNVGIRATVSKTRMDRLLDGIHAILRGEDFYPAAD